MADSRRLGSRECGTFLESAHLAGTVQIAQLAHTKSSRIVPMQEGYLEQRCPADDVTACKNCSAGKYSSAKGMAQQSGCNPCSMGRFSNVSGISSISMCQLCPVDTYTSMPGQTSCKECDDGTLTKGENGSTVCNLCDAGEEIRGGLGSAMSNAFWQN